MLSFTDKELRQQEEREAAADPKAKNHACWVPTNYAGDTNGTIFTCACGQTWRMKSGFFFSKWVRV